MAKEGSKEGSIDSSVFKIKPFHSRSYGPRKPDSVSTQFGTEKENLIRLITSLSDDTRTIALQKYYEAAFNPKHQIIPLNINETLHLIQDHNARNIHVAVFSERHAELRAGIQKPISALMGKPELDELTMLRQLSRGLGLRTPLNTGDTICMADELKIRDSPDRDSSDPKDLEKQLLIKIMQQHLDTAKHAHIDYKARTVLWLQDATKFYGNDRAA